MDAHHRMLIGLGAAVVAGLIVRTHALWTAALAFTTRLRPSFWLICVTIALSCCDYWHNRCSPACIS